MWADIHRRLRGNGEPIPVESLAALMAAIGQKVLLSPEEVALLYDYEIQTLAQMRSQGRGPAYTKEGRLVRYRRDSIEQYFSALEVQTRDQRF
jgi:hypothetical protein